MLTTKRNGFLILAAMGAALAGCSGDDASTPPGVDSGTSGQQDAAAVQPDTGAALDLYPDLGVAPDLYPDLGVAPDIGQKADPCEKEWIDALAANDKVSTGAVATTDKGGGVKETLIDASAGGMNQAHTNPYVYVSLADGSRVDITDLQAKTSTAWDLALRRTVIRVNGGDSGPGQGAVAIVENTPLDTVTAVPASATFAADEFIDEQCNVQRDPINNPMTAFGGSDGLWYEYSASTSKVEPKPHTYVVRRADGTFAKVVIDSYYSNVGQSAHFAIRWSAL